jgi:hypothetical protein
MKKILLSLLVLSSVVYFSGCKSGGDPKAVLNQFFEALAKNDIAGARKFATTESKDMLDMMEMGMKMAPDSKENSKYSKDKMEIGEPKIEGDKATIAVKEKDSGESMNFSMQKEKGEWKVVFDKSSVMGMGMEKMKEKGMDGKEELEKAMKDINTDSLKNEMQEAMKSLDSVKTN